MATLNKRGNLNYLLLDMIRVVANIGLMRFCLPQMLGLIGDAITATYLQRINVAQ
jgi:hypothetical protein